MPLDLNDFEAVLEMLEDKLVRTSRGSFIAIEDLRNLVKERAELRQTDREMPRHKTMVAARTAALRDEALRAMFEPSPAPSPDLPNPAVVRERTAQTATSA